MAEQRFGSAHTKDKLEKLERYLNAYSTALKNQGFRLLFFDAFAGTGDIQIGEETPLLQPVDDYKPFIKGSAHRALELGTAFDEYIFVERSPQKFRELAALRDEFSPIADRIHLKCDDANVALRIFCTQTNWNKCRAVVFLDPFGNQVEWATLEVIAATKAIDLWYLFPSGLGVNRQIGKDGSVHFQHGPALDRILGKSDWREAFITQQPVDDLFDGRRLRSAKRADPTAITEYMISRMREIFGGGVLDEWVPLGSKNVHMYSLIFAWANPGEAARKLAQRLAKTVLKSGGTSGRAK
jgi:three-Cys-motif partner protein